MSSARTSGKRVGQSSGHLPAIDFTTGQDLNLSDGFALFPKLGTIRALSEYRATGVPLGEYDNTLDQFSLVFNANLTAFYGIAGPAYVADVQTTGNSVWSSTSASGTQATFEISSSRFAAGIEAGFTVAAQMNCELDSLAYGNDTTLIDLSPNCTIDLLNLLLQVIELILDEDDDPSLMTKLDNLTNNGVLSSWGIYDQNLSAFQDGADGTVLTTTLNPTFILNINIVSLLDGIPVADVIPALDAALAEVDGGFSFGPSFQFGIPTTVRVVSVQLDGESLPAWNYTNERDLPLAYFGSPGVPVLSSPPTSIGMTFEHIVSFTFGVGFFANVQAAKVFNFPYNSHTIDLLELFHITAPTFGPYDNTLTYSTGGDQVPASAPTITGWFETQPFHQIWVGGVIAQYAVSFTDGSYETPIGPWTPTDPSYSQLALARLADVPTDPTGLATGRKVYRTFGDGTTTLVGTIPDNTTTTFVDNNY